MNNKKYKLIEDNETYAIYKPIKMLSGETHSWQQISKTYFIKAYAIKFLKSSI